MRLSDDQVSYITALAKHRKGITAENLASTVVKIWGDPFDGNTIHQTLRELKGKADRNKPNQYDPYWSVKDPFKQTHLKIYSWLYETAILQIDLENAMDNVTKASFRERWNRQKRANEFGNGTMKPAIRDLTIVDQMKRDGIMDKKDKNHA